MNATACNRKVYKDDYIINYMEEKKIFLNTVFLLVGPTCSGKSYFTKNVLTPQLKEQGFNLSILSSDDIRSNLLGYNSLEDSPYDKSSKEMMSVSKHAFDLLFTQLNTLTSYPVNREFIAVDTTGLNEFFRNQIIDICKENHYRLELITFDYKDKEDYTKYLDKNTSQRVLFTHLKRFNKDFKGNMKLKNYNNIHKIQSRDISNIKFIVDNKEELDKRKLDDDKEYVIIGDVHGCYNEMIEIIEKNNFEIENGLIKPLEKKEIIFVGDLIDKGKDTIKVVDFIYNNLKNIKVVKGNHENFVYKYIKGLIKKVDDEVLAHFDSIKLKGNENFVMKLNKIVENSSEFYFNKNFITCHSLTELKYLKKVDKVSLNNQLKTRYPQLSSENGMEEFKKQFEFLNTDAETCYPYYVFGHIPFNKIYMNKNFVGIDTGCVDGNKLSSVSITSDGRLFSKSILSKQEKNEDKTFLRGNEIREKKEILYNDLEPYELKRLEYNIEDKVNFISGTMSPADKNENDLETIESALNYYKEKGIDKIVLQPKYMGSRCNIYLFEDVNKCYSTSRNGFKIRNVENYDIKEVYKTLINKFKYKFNDNTKMLLLDGEMLPWYHLGKGLIEDFYGSLIYGNESDLTFLKENGFEEELNKTLKDEDYLNYLNDKDKLSNKELSKKYSKYPYYKEIQNLLNLDIQIDKELEYNEILKEQLKIFGSDSKLEYKPFMILKEVFKDNSEKLYFNENNDEIFKQINDDELKVIDLNDKNYLEESKKYYSLITSNKKMEGVVVKPQKVSNDWVAPYMKVRNPKYLTLIYGYDYLKSKKYSKLINKKNINKKLQTSIKEFNIGKKLLEIPYNEINENNDEYKKLIISFIHEENREKGLDPRL